MKIHDSHLKYVLLLMFLIFCVFTGATVVHAANSAIPASDITIDYSDQILDVTLGKNTTLYYATGSAEKVPDTWDEIDSSQLSIKKTGETNSVIATIDFSFLSPSKDQYIYMKGDVDTEPVCVPIPKQLKLKVTFAGLLDEATDPSGAFATAYSEVSGGNPVYKGFSKESGYFLFHVDNADYTNFSNIEWRKGLSGNWEPFQLLTPEKYKMRGATLYFRINNGTHQISNECKVTYSKKANAPSINVDGSKHTLKLSTKLEYRIKVGDGAFNAWTTPTFTGNATNGILKIKDLSGANAASNGNGLTSSFQSMVIEVRTKATEKKVASKTRSIFLYSTTAPVFGSSGIEVSQVNANDIKKGLIVTNHSDLDYQVAIVNKKVSESSNGVYAAIENIDLTARNREDGYVAFINVKAGKSTTISYSKFQDFPDSYAVICRVAAIRENTRTANIEFRLASAIVPVGGDTPVSNIQSGAIMMTKDQTEVTKDVIFTVENENSVIYTSLNNAAFTANSSGKVTVTGTKGSKSVIKAYAKDSISGDVSDTVTITLYFVADGELDDYKNEWGYYLCSKEDSENSSSSRKIAYQRIYLAYVQYNEEVDLSDLNLSPQQTSIIVQRVRVDNPELLQASGNFSYTSYNAGIVHSLSLAIMNKTTAEALKTECESCLTTVKDKIKSLYGDNPTKLKQIKVIHDYLVLKNQYHSSSLDQTIAGALCTGYTPVCMAYSMAFKYLCDNLDIQTVVILGYAGTSITNRHAWNNINLSPTVTYANEEAMNSDNWYEMDVTWDDPVNQAADYVGYTYFNITTAKMTASAHHRLFEEYSSYPVASCTGTTFTYAQVKAASNYSNDETIKESTQKDSVAELIKRSGVKVPNYTEE